MASKKRKSKAEEIPAFETNPDAAPLEIVELPPTKPILETLSPALKKPRPARPIGVVAEAPKVELRVYLATCGDKPDMVAGFAYWARKHGPATCTIKGWRALREEFNRRPM